METQTLTVKAVTESLDEVLSFIETIAADMPPKLSNQLAIAVEEVFVNIANYAYESGGDAVITAQSDDEKLVITFEDSGTPYNPLQKSDPDTEASADDREIGGLGIFMIKKLTDGIEYDFSDGKNILKIHKSKKL
jgi:anti-sigma regulatory factor (Ser/Thr protein kinase)